MLYQLAGLTSLPAEALEPQQLEELQAVLVTAAGQAIAGGVSLRLEEWAALDTLERAAWTVARRRAHVQNVCEFVAAQRDELRAAELYSQVDGGQVHDDIMMDRVMQVAMLSMDRGS